MHRPACPGTTWAPSGGYLAAQDAAEAGSPPGPAAGIHEPAGPGRLDRLTGHGSDRRFWRLAVGDWSAVAMVGGAGDEEFDRMVAIARFLGRS